MKKTKEEKNLTIPKLSLNRETLRMVAAERLGEVVGGDRPELDYRPTFPTWGC